MRLKRLCLGGLAALLLCGGARAADPSDRDAIFLRALNRLLVEAGTVEWKAAYCAGRFPATKEANARAVVDWQKRNEDLLAEVRARRVGIESLEAGLASARSKLVRRLDGMKDRGRAECEGVPRLLASARMNLRVAMESDFLDMHSGPTPQVVMAIAPPAPALRLEQAECRKPGPDYPRRAMVANAEGTVRLRVAVEPGGQVASVEVVRSSGDTEAHKLLDEAAAAWQRECRFAAFEGTAPRFAERELKFALKP